VGGTEVKTPGKKGMFNMVAISFSKLLKGECGHDHKRKGEWDKGHT